MSERISFGAWLRRRRKALDLTQAALARQAGCVPGTIKSIEADARRPSRQLAERLADVLAVHAEERRAFLKAARGELAPDRLPASSTPAHHLAVPAADLPALPQATMTLLVTDLEGSPALWEQQPQAMRQALARHDALIREASRTHGGAVAKDASDGVHAAFRIASAAVAAAVAAQRAFTTTDWGAPAGVRVRMALHTGAVEEHAGEYVGLTRTRGVRLLQAGHGGQLLLSAATAALVVHDLPEGVGLRPLGAHRILDRQHPEGIFQLRIDGVPDAVASLTTRGARPNNLPTQATPLIGREREVGELITLLRRSDVRLVTLTGPGGVGKTRLSLHLAAELLDDFADGAFVVELAPVADPALVPAAIMTSLGVVTVGGQQPVATLNQHLGDKHLLLVLDNFEHVVSAADTVAALLTAAPRLKVVVTSRALLRIYGEHTYPVPLLALPDPQRLPAPEHLSQYAAVALFVARACAARPDFQVTTATAPAVAEICVRLDGLPLAIELAAARVRLFPPPVLLQRLDNRLKLLTGGAHDRAARQQTLRAALDWSHHLLNRQEQRMFARLAVFVGGCTLEAIAAVCVGDEELERDPIDVVTSLFDQSLVRWSEGPAGEPRVHLLETIREYALERLAASGEAPSIRGRHGRYYAALAHQIAPELRGPQQAALMGRLAVEHDNLRAALAWALDSADAERAARLAGSLHEFWIAHGHQAEGRRWLERVLAVERTLPASIRAQVLLAAGALARSQSDYALATRRYEECLALAQAEDDRRGIAEALAALAFAIMVQSADVDRAGILYEQSLALSRELGDKAGMARALAALGFGALERGDQPRMRRLLDESLALAREVGDQIGIASVLSYYGWAALADGAVRRALALFEKSRRHFDEVGHKDLTAYALLGLGNAAILAGDVEHGRAHLARSLRIYAEVGDRVGSIWGVESLAGAAALSGDPVRAARLGGAAEAAKSRIKLANPRTYGLVFARTITPDRAPRDAAWNGAWTEGQAMTLEQAVAYALEGSIPQ